MKKENPQSYQCDDRSHGYPYLYSRQLCDV